MHHLSVVNLNVAAITDMLHVKLLANFNVDEPSFTIIRRCFIPEFTCKIMFQNTSTFINNNRCVGGNVFQGGGSLITTE